MTYEPRNPAARQQANVEPFGFNLWAMEVATMDHAATNLAYLVHRAISLIQTGFDALVDGIERLRAACPIEVEPVKIVRPQQSARTEQATGDRRAAA